ncbi:cytochrome oxidase assembly protein 1 [Mycoemilia scoparia]|uniref:Cytochrome oxidase assembly protein 1 n=1 Tax=Mycoemilia scoparia TaxID=417184 RepID=A0A9W8A305_9FUNG|nr:cytochrome oxidase assembly protein 1 [Mycoemilia scoparia]
MHKRSLDEAVAGNSEFAIERELPTPKNKTKEIVLFILASIVTWGIGTQVAFNYQRMTSTAVTTALFSARHNPQIQAIFGNYLDFSSPLTWISGEASNLHGKVDLSFNVKGNGSTGKLFLKSRRQGSGENAKWVTSEFYVLTDDGKKIELSL